MSPSPLFFLGGVYFKGLGVDADPAQAFGWFTKASDRGSATGTGQLSILYARGPGITQNLDKAEQYAILAAKEGETIWLRKLAVMYATGNGMPITRREVERARRRLLMPEMRRRRRC